MSLAILGALSYGLSVVDSKEISLDLDKNIEFSVNNKSEDYLKILHLLFAKKQQKQLDRSSVKNYFKRNFSSEIIDPKLFKQVFGVS